MVGAAIEDGRGAAWATYASKATPATRRLLASTSTTHWLVAQLATVTVLPNQSELPEGGISTFPGIVQFDLTGVNTNLGFNLLFGAYGQV